MSKTDSCWLYAGSIDRYGYGRIGNFLAHRVMFQDAGNELIAGLEIDHLCRVRRCINPAHLEQVTHKENTLRGFTITAKNKAVTHCPKGHEYDDENTYITPKGLRMCRECNRIAVSAYKKRIKQS